MIDNVLSVCPHHIYELSSTENGKSEWTCAVCQDLQVAYEDSNP